jgi:Arc/MetJ-type ribon-helix-helix transcriptional regulator
MKPSAGETVTIRISLPRELAAFVHRSVADGIHGSPDEVVQAALRSFAHSASAQQRRDGACASWPRQETAIDPAAARVAMRRLRRLRKGTRLGPDLSTKDLIASGRA